MFDVIVIGGGPAGTTAALRARELGASVALVEGGLMGGTCTNDGCAPTRVLAKAARLARDSVQFPAFGLVPYAPQVDLETLMTRVETTIERLHDKKQLIENLQNAGVTLFVGQGDGRFVDPHTLEIGGSRRLAADRFIICAGGHARRIDFPGSEHALTHHDVWRLRQVPPAVTIVGGAATGCQLATIFNAFGSDVTLLEAAPRLLTGEDHHVSAALTAGFRSRGIEVLTGIQGLERLAPDGASWRLSFRRDDSTVERRTGAIILAVGWVGNLEKLNLDAAGVRTERGYIVTDEGMQTSAPHIFAAGDINGRMMLVQSAAHEARRAAENAVLGQAASFAHQIVPHGGFTDPEYGSVGLTEAQAGSEADPITALTAYRDLDRAVIDSRTEGFCKLVVSRQTRRLLGAHVVGEQALEVVQIAAACMAGRLEIHQIAELELAYPTYAMIIGLTARRLVRELGLTPIAAEWRALQGERRTTAEWEKASYIDLQEFPDSENGQT